MKQGIAYIPYMVISYRMHSLHGHLTSHPFPIWPYHITACPSKAHEAGELLTVVGALKENATIALVVFTYMLVPKVPICKTIFWWYVQDYHLTAMCQFRSSRLPSLQFPVVPSTMTPDLCMTLR